jgi:hypothetical protein
VKQPICNGELYEEVAQELGISEELVIEVAQAQSLLTKKIIKAGFFEQVLYPYLGKFKIKTKLVQTIEHMKGFTDEQRIFYKRFGRGS